MRRFTQTVVSGLLCVSLTGCALVHDLQPHRLWRFNRGPAPSSDPYFSISDPIPQLTPRRGGLTPLTPPNTDPEHTRPVADDE